MENRIEGVAGAAIRMEMRGTLRAFSHDMRTPLENVIALATLSLEKLKMEAKESAEVIVPYLRKILIAAHDMEALTEDLMQEENLNCAQERFSVRDISESVSAAISARAAQRRQRVQIDISGFEEEMVKGDGAALRRILTNLMSNAVKYTPEEGRISLIARGRRNERGVIEAEFIVEDNGMGMDAAFMKRMYEPYARSQEALGSSIEGNGLGLTIVQQMTKRMNGTITAISEPGRGTRFTLRVPFGVRAEENARSLTGKRFLLAEDNDLSAEIAEEILREKGASVYRVANGSQAVKLFLSCPEGKFDAVLMDMRMPEMDGCMAAAKIRCMQRADAGSIPVFALTAGCGEQDERAALAAGMNGCLSKPLDVDKLAAIISGKKQIVGG